MTCNVFNHESEAYLLGVAMSDPKAMEDILSRLNAEDFDHPRHAIIFESIARLHGQRISPDLQAVVADLRSAGKLDLIGGPIFVSQVYDTGVSSANMAWHIKEVIEKRNRRLLKRLGEFLVRASAEASETIESINERMDKERQKIADRSITGYQHISNFAPALISKIELASKNRGKLTGVPTGIPTVDRVTYGLAPGKYVIVGAKPGVGKTTMQLQMMAEAALRGGKAVGMISLEMDGDELLQKITANMASVPGNAMNSGMMSAADMQSFLSFQEEVWRSKIYVNDTAGLFIHEIESEARRMKRKENIDALYIDYFSLIMHPDRRMERHRQLADCSIRLKNLARELKIPIVVASQLRREDGKEPTLESLSETKQLEQDADIVILLHSPAPTTSEQQLEHEERRQRGEEKLKVKVEKHRGGAKAVFEIMHKQAYSRMIEIEE